MKVAVAQMNTRAGDFDATIARMVAYASRAKALGADVLVYPYVALMGLDPAALAENDAYVADAIRAMSRLAREVELTCLVPFVFDVGGALGSDVALVRDGEAVPLSLLSWLGRGEASGAPDLEELAHDLLGDDEDAVADDLADSATAGSGPATVSICGVEVGVALGYDDLDAFAAGEASADVLFYLPTDGYDTDDESSCLAPSVSDGCFVNDAADANAWIVAANAVGGYEDAVFSGGSFVMAPWGELAAVAPSFAEDLLVCDIPVMSEGPLREPVEAPAYDRVRMLWEACTLATRDQVEKRELKGVALALDGTLGSSALAALAVDAVGPLRVSALICARDEEALADARTLARNLRIRDVDELSARDLDRAADALGGDGDASELARGLVEARLGSLARAGHVLALSAADKTGLAVGLAEGCPAPVSRAVSFAPFGDIYRSDVAGLARRRNAASPSIPVGTLTRMAVPEGLGLERFSSRPELMVSELDAALLMLIERGGGMAELAAGRLGEELAARLLGRVRAGEAARRSGPSYPVVSARSLAEASRPVTDAWQDQGHGATMEALGPDDVVSALQGIMRTLASADAPQEKAEAHEAPRTTDGAGARVSEIMGYLEDISAGKRLREQSSGASGSGPDDPWPAGMFSDN